MYEGAEKAGVVVRGGASGFAQTSASACTA